MTRDDWLVVAAVVQAIGALASVVIAIVAVSLAVRADRTTRETAFVPHIVNSLFTCLRLAAEVRERYMLLLGHFETEEGKSHAMTDWLQHREEVLTTLTQMSGAFLETQSALDAWQALENEENPHIYQQVTQALNPAGANEARRKYDLLHNKFVEEVLQVLRTLRNPKRKVG